jgi:hypothetical protein
VENDVKIDDINEAARFKKSSVVVRDYYTINEVQKSIHRLMRNVVLTNSLQEFKHVYLLSVVLFHRSPSLLLLLGVKENLLLNSLMVKRVIQIENHI